MTKEEKEVKEQAEENNRLNIAMNSTKTEKELEGIVGREQDRIKTGPLEIHEVGSGLSMRERNDIKFGTASKKRGEKDKQIAELLNAKSELGEKTGLNLAAEEINAAMKREFGSTYSKKK